MKTSLSFFALAALLAGGCAQDPVRRHKVVDTSTVYENRDADPETQDKPEDKPQGEDDGEPFIIRSPFGKHRRMDLTGMKPGTHVQDPVTGGIFKVPAAKDETPEIVSDPPADWKPEN
jgi:hypothetical protein